MLMTNVDFMFDSNCDFEKRTETSVAVKVYNRNEIRIMNIDSDEEISFYVPKNKIVIISADRIDNYVVEIKFFIADSSDEEVSEETNIGISIYADVPISHRLIINSSLQRTFLDIEMKKNK